MFRRLFIVNICAVIAGTTYATADTSKAKTNNWAVANQNAWDKEHAQELYWSTHKLNPDLIVSVKKVDEGYPEHYEAVLKDGTRIKMYGYTEKGVKKAYIIPMPNNNPAEPGVLYYQDYDYIPTSPENYEVVDKTYKAQRKEAKRPPKLIIPKRFA